MDVGGLTDIQLQNLIDNHRRLKATDRPLYAIVVEEWHRRHGGKLDLQKSLAFIRKAASEGRFISYGELAEANGVSWEQVRYPMNAHLWALVDYARRQGWPMLSAIIVNKRNVATGDMDDPTLKGFIEAAKALGYSVTDEYAFLREQQRMCFEWGKQAQNPSVG